MRQQRVSESTTREGANSDAAPGEKPRTKRPAWTTAELAEFSGLGISTLNRKRCDGTGPRFIKVGRTVRYDPDDGEAWLEANKRRSTSEITNNAGASK